MKLNHKKINKAFNIKEKSIQEKRRRIKFPKGV
jgi:hypothetical protein